MDSRDINSRSCMSLYKINYGFDISVFRLLGINITMYIPLQGSPKCGIVGGDKIEVGEKLEHLGGSEGMLPPGNFENLQHL